MNNNKGIIAKLKTEVTGVTLISLTVTVVVLFILTAVTVRLALGDNGVISEAQDTADKWEKSVQDQQSDLAKLASEMKKVRNGIIISGTGGGNTGTGGGTDIGGGNTGGNTGGNNTGGGNTGGETGGDNTGGSTWEKPTFAPTTTEANSAVTFVTEVGKIDVIWLDTNNNIRENPNSPAGYLNAMKPVKWDGTTEVETTTSDANWYNYASIEGDGDNTTSHWANAKNFGSYFVWIPRYAYRITYYDSSDLTEPTGYYDGCGMWKSTGELKLSLEEGIETEEKNGYSYIVHPAFIDDSANGFNNGGWDKDLAGIWVGKYESCRSDATVNSAGTSDTIKVMPTVRSWVSITIGNCYTNAYNYERTKESHLMKNSEWGAVAYLTHSQYGRNGHEIDRNNNLYLVTGIGAGTSTSYTSATTNSYTTAYGQKASSTGNIYGIYDLSGGADEFVAAFNASGNASYLNNGASFASATNNSTKYATRYNNNNTSTNVGTMIYEAGKTGDSTKEVLANKNNTNWFDDNSYFINSYPFFRRGGVYSYTYNSIGVFSSYNDRGSGHSSYSFRIVLAI